MFGMRRVSPTLREVLSFPRLVTPESLFCAYCGTLLLNKTVLLVCFFCIGELNDFLLHWWAEEERQLGAMQMSVPDWLDSQELPPSRAHATRTLILKILLIWKPTNTNSHHDGSVFFCFFPLTRDSHMQLFIYLFPSWLLSLHRCLLTGDILHLSSS